MQKKKQFIFKSLLDYSGKLIYFYKDFIVSSQINVAENKFVCFMQAGSDDYPRMKHIYFDVQSTPLLSCQVLEISSSEINNSQREAYNVCVCFVNNKLKPYINQVCAKLTQAFELICHLKTCN